MKRLVLIACFGVLSYAQSDTASLSGVITDPGAAVIAAAKITLHNKATGSSRTTLSDIQGLYCFSVLIPGAYELTIDLARDETVSHPGTGRAAFAFNQRPAGRLDSEVTANGGVPLLSSEKDSGPPMPNIGSQQSWSL